MENPTYRRCWEGRVTEYLLFICLPWPDHLTGISGPGDQRKWMLEGRLFLGPGGLG